MSAYAISMSSLVKEYTTSVAGVIRTLYKCLCCTQASCMKNIEANVKHVDDLSNKFCRAEWNSVLTKNHPTFELEKVKVMTKFAVALKQRTIRELKTARTHCKKEGDQAVEK